MAAGDTILDPFAGGGTTLVEAKLLQRHAIGLDINPYAIELCQQAVDFPWPNSGEITIRQGDPRDLSFLTMQLLILYVRIHLTLTLSVIALRFTRRSLSLKGACFFRRNGQGCSRPLSRFKRR